MTGRQMPLFDDETPNQAVEKRIIRISQPDRPLTKAQQTFNRLVAKVERLRTRLDNEISRLNKALAFYGKHLHSRLVKQTALRKDLIRALAPFLDDPRLKKKYDRELLSEIIALQFNEIIEAEGTLQDEDLQALFKQVHDIDFGQIEREEMEDARANMEAMYRNLGIEVDLSGLRPDMTEGELAAKAAEMAEAIQQKVKEVELGSGQPIRPKTKRQLEKEQRLQQAEALQKRGIAAIYKQLARVLHPDLEQDPERKKRKTTLMKELTAAYQNNDLHTLLRLELEWIHREEGDLERLSDEKLAIYNDGLKEQVQELEQELDSFFLHPRYRPLVVADGPFGFYLRPTSPAEVRSLNEFNTSMEVTIARLHTDQAIHEIRAIVRDSRRAIRDDYC